MSDRLSLETEIRILIFCSPGIDPTAQFDQRNKEPCLDGNLVDFVENIDARNIDTVALDDVDELFRRRIVPQRDVGIVDAVLTEDRLYGVDVKL